MLGVIVRGLAAWVGVALGITGGPAGAASIAGVTPQGEVAQVRQVVVRFSEPVIALGDLRRPDPMGVECGAAAPAGSGRWADEKTWLFDFRTALPPGVRCSVRLRSDWKPLAGMLSGARDFAFATGGPAIVQVEPGDGATIEEDQHFLLRLTGPAAEASVLANAWCEVEGIGERMAVRVVAGAPREALIRARRLDKLADRLLLLACPRPLPNEAAMRLVWGRGIAAQANPQVLTRSEQRQSYTVRKAFSAEFSCERERANAPCIAVRPLVLRFSAPVARSLAQQVRLKPEHGTAIAPQFDKDDKDAEVREITFARPVAENARFTIELPRDLKDGAGRPLANAGSFPLAVATGSAPPIAKFAAAPFGVIERDAEPLLPVTLRHVQDDLRSAAPGGQVRSKHLTQPTDILAWFARVRRFHENELSAREIGLPSNQWYATEEDTDARGRKIKRRVERRVATREVSLLAGEPGVQRHDLPQLDGGDPRPFEVVGIPLRAAGYHVVEIESRRLGQALLDKAAPMFVRTGVLVTNLGVHFKQGRENSLVWVTALDRGRPVDGADVAVHDCRGRELWSGRTDASGVARIARALDPGTRDCVVDDGLFVTARVTDAHGDSDIAFVFGDWHRGIEPWRFNLPTAGGTEPERRAHTVFDRTLLRAGETVSMKHFVRTETAAGLAALRAEDLPTRAKLVHDASGQEFELPLQWNGTRSALSSWVIPRAARLGLYRVLLERDAPKRAADEAAQRTSWESGQFRVEEFRVPLVDARLAGPKQLPVAPQKLALDLQLSYLAGGGMAQAVVRASALLRDRAAGMAGHDEYSFDPPRDPARPEGEEDATARDGTLVADKLPLTTDARGAARFALEELPKITRPAELLAEVAFNDPNGETQTVATTLPLWPSAVVVGIKAANWASSSGRIAVTALALDTAGKPVAGQAIEVRARVAQVISSRKRLVGGFYAYDNRTEFRELGTPCKGVTDAHGLLPCEAALDAAGQVELIAAAVDAAGHKAEAATGVWITKQGELWFEQDNDDRVDVLPERKRYEPGETARLQVRTPFREATALVAIEREGVIDTRVVTLRGDDPTVELKIERAWAPNVYVSVLAVRGRIRQVPWYSFFTWGWKEPLAWLRGFWYEGREYRAPTAMVDLAKPAFKLGVAALQVGLAEHRLEVSVVADQAQYGVRQKALARVRVTQDGKPLAGAEVAFAAVDEGLLALRDNDSWKLLDAMLRPRPWGVVTSTAASEIIGRRHYGRKAVAAGGGGGRGATRELFETLLLWKPQVVLDANGEARIEVPLNDSLTSFRLVAVADAGVQQFGSGSTTIRVTQDLQLLAGLPPLVRDGDRFSAMLTLRNTTARAMKVRATLAGTPQADGGAAAPALALPAQELALAAGAAQEIAWPVDVPADAARIAWEAAAEEIGGGARDRLRLTQRVDAAVPVRVLQATLQQLDGRSALPVAPPDDALPASGIKRGGVVVALQPRLGSGLPGIRRFFETYPFSCLEQKLSKAIALHDAALWAEVANTLPTYLDADGLANYFPPRSEDAPRGSDRLSAYVLAAAHEAGLVLPAAARDRLLDGLTAFVEGRIERRFWAPRADLEVRKLAAIEALARHGRAQPRMLGSIEIAPNNWPTAALIDWLAILRRMPGIEQHAARLAEAQQILRSRLSYAGTTLRFSNEDDDFWWWLMDSADANAARLLLAVLDDPAWRDELPRLVVGGLARQRGGAWLTTTANLWGALALDKFGRRYESAKVAGRSSAVLGAASAAVDWSREPDGARLALPWPAASGGELAVTHQGSGKPWLTVQSLAAVALAAPLRAGYAVTRSVTAVEQKDKARWSRGDVLRVRLEIDAQAAMSWVVLSDPVPGGATILGSGLGRDSAIAVRQERREGSAWAAYEERAFAAFRAYYEYMPRGRHVVEYTLRLNNPGRFALPPTRVEAMYAPESFGETPNDAIEVGP